MKLFIIASVFTWLSASIAGITYLNRYENTPGVANTVYPAVLPAATRLTSSSDRPTLIFFAHPKCPCTHASLNELARLMADIQGKVTAYVVFIKPTGETEDWTDTSTRRVAEALPNVTVVIDEDEQEAKLFGAETSGLTLLYDRYGTLRFNGGITSARAHEGDNAGKGAVFDIVTADASTIADTPVFGCPLHKKDCPGEMPPSPD